MSYLLKVITTTDRQLDDLNVILEFETFEDTIGQIKLFIEQGYRVEVEQSDEE